jgi:hypothetical protein
MGQARKRGSFEERVHQAVQRRNKEEEEAWIKQQEANVTPSKSSKLRVFAILTSLLSVGGKKRSYTRRHVL